MTLRLAVELTADASGLRGELRLSEEDLKKLGSAAERTGASTEHTARSFDRLERSTSSADVMMRRLYQTLIAVGAFQIARGILQQADAWAQTNAQIRRASEGLVEASEAAEALFDIAQDAGTRLGDTVSIFRSIARIAPDLGATADEILQVTENVQRLASLSGAGPEQISAGLLQFGQAMAEGVVRAEEFNSVLTNITPLADAIADGLGVSNSELRRMVNDGSLLASDVFEVILAQTGEIAEKFAELPPTMGRALTQLQNSWQRVIGEANEAGGATNAFVGAIDSLRQLVDSPGFQDSMRLLLSLLGGVADALRWILDNLPIGGAVARLNVPAAAETALEEVRNQIAQHETRLLAATGPGGNVGDVNQLRSVLAGLRDREAQLQDALTDALIAAGAPIGPLDGAGDSPLTITVTPGSSGRGGGRVPPGSFGGGRSAGNDTAARLAALEAEAELEQKLAQLYGASEESLARLAEMREIATTAAQLDIQAGTQEFDRLSKTIRLRNAAQQAIEEETAARNRAQELIERHGDAERRYALEVANTVALLPQLIELLGDRAEAERIVGAELDRLEEQYRDLGRAGEFAEGVFDAIGDAGRSALRALQDETITTADIVNAFLNDLYEALYRLTVLNPLEAAFEGLLGGFDFGGIIRSLFGGGGGFGGGLPYYPGAGYLPGTGGIYHAGGIVGVTSVPTRAVDLRLWEGAPRYHRGGLLPGEEPVIAKRGEQIDYPANLARMYGSSFTIIDQRGANAPDLEVRNEEQPGGGRDVRVIIREATDTDIRSGRYDAAMAARYSLRPVGRR